MLVTNTQQDSVTAVVASGNSILAASVDGTVRRFDVRTGTALTDRLHHPVTGLAVTADGLCVLAACLDSCLRLLDAGSGQQLAAYTAPGYLHESVKMDCCLTPSDAYVVGSSETGEAGGMWGYMGGETGDEGERGEEREWGIGEGKAGSRWKGARTELAGRAMPYLHCLHLVCRCHGM